MQFNQIKTNQNNLRMKFYQNHQLPAVIINFDSITQKYN
jgi:hypothetical protein